MFEERIDYRGDLTPVAAAACAAYGLGRPRGFKVVETGYEDCNAKVETERGGYLLKIFSKVRTAGDIARLAAILGEVARLDIAAPRLYEAGGEILFRHGALSMVCMDWIDGESFFDSNTSPDDGELRQILAALAKMGEVRLPEGIAPLFDSWAVQNIHGLFNEAAPAIGDRREMELARRALATYDGIPMGRLPAAFVHGDITKQNVIKGADGRVWLVDFSVSDVYPRIQALAVIASNLLHGNGNSLRQNAEKVLRAGGEFFDLQGAEREFFADYCLASAAMEYLGSMRQKHLRGDDGFETAYWLKAGLEGMASYEG